MYTYYYRRQGAFLLGHYVALAASVLLMVCAGVLMLTFAQSLRASTQPALAQRVDARQVHHPVVRQQHTQPPVAAVYEEPRNYYSDL